MKFGFIGAGVVAQTIARRLLPFGHEVLLSNSRGPDTLADVVGKLGRSASAGTLQQAAEQDVVVLSVEWAHDPEALASVPDWSGRTLIDATNWIDCSNPRDLGDLSGRTSSEIVADQAVGAKVVSGFDFASQSEILAEVTDRVASGGLRMIVSTWLDGLTVENTKTTHEHLESRRTIGKIVIAA